jgi:hypothetical protein
MSFSAVTLIKPAREKVFGAAHGIPLDRNAKARIIAFAKGYNARHKQPGQHCGPLTWAFQRVLLALVWGFHNSRDGRCFPSYEAIAAKAGCCRDTVYEAIIALEKAGILSWVNRFTKIREATRNLFGQIVKEWKVKRLSNAYVFRDPLPCAPAPNYYKSENPTGTGNQDSSLLRNDPKPPLPPLSPELNAALVRLGSAIADRMEREGTLPKPQ